MKLAKTLIKHISGDCESTFDIAAYNSNQKWKNDKCKCESKKYQNSKEDYSLNPSTYIRENRYL